MAKILREDFLLNANGDFPLQDTVINGIWQETPYGASDAQHVEDIIIDSLGSTKSSPTLGFGVKRYLNAETSIYDVFKSLKEHLSQDDYEAREGAVKIIGKGFLIDTSFISRK